jgi:CHASE3 domain sensor protein
MGDRMKKILVPLFSAIVIGFVLGKYFFSQYEEKIDSVFQSDEKIYVLQQGVYSTMENVKKYTTKAGNYIVEEDGKYFRVYVAITSNKNNLSRLREYFISKGNDIYVRELQTNNSVFLELLKQYDMLLESGSGDNELIQIEKQVIDKYEELVLNK